MSADLDLSAIIEEAAAWRRDMSNAYVRAHFADVPLYLSTMVELRVVPRGITIGVTPAEMVDLGDGRYSFRQRLYLIEEPVESRHAR